MSRIFFITLFISISSFGQNNIQKDTIYMDENQIEITKAHYENRMNNSTLYARSYETKKIIIYKLLYRFYFGKISEKELKQIHLLLAKDGKVDINNNATILIKFTDTLYDFNTLKIRNEKHAKNHLYHKTSIKFLNNKKDSIKVKHKPFNKKVYLSNIKKYAIKQKKCAEKLLKKRNTFAFNVYKYNKGYSFNENLRWIKDKIFKNKFFKIMYENNLIIIKPNGDYFLKSGHFSDKSLHKLLKSEDWNHYIKDWKNSLNRNQKKGIGIIKDFNYPHNTSHCY